ncbi:peptidase M61 domain protein [Chloroherpeton thalassium ATCC 35110]|uniref:Peptidase M61 domain protein n=1 Tax=Chloroherpeton thalassium (strain ATCC 35110 / GB-78) TaxID=517418 RepID=B3QW35_CHLT3|nr:PDZ domain-containing protein [Chloroherpeton thalassium]ACF14689.1 peptidase M61 domain protein [Chloroherpeton thalassium ATCC 35110]
MVINDLRDNNFLIKTSYHISFENRAHHEAEVTVIFEDVQPDVLTVAMSRASPGRYSLHEFAKNIYSVKAFDREGILLSIARPNPHQWEISGHQGYVKLAYTLFGDRADGTYVSIHPTYIHLNMPAAFLWAKDFAEQGIRLTVDLPDENQKILTQLFPTEAPNVFLAPNMQYFMDSPLQIAPFEIREWKEDFGQSKFGVRLGVFHTGASEEISVYEKMTKRLVRESLAVWKDAPRFETGEYVFMCTYQPYVEWDGMEHRNSTVLTSQKLLKTDALDSAGTLVHEFFHAWNVERLRPASLEPFQFDRENISDELWFCEGITSYYDNLLLNRASVQSVDKFCERLSVFLTRLINTPSRKLHSPVEMSRQAAFQDRASFYDRTNTPNIFISYYTYGAALSLALDLSLRTEFHLTLDEYLQSLWNFYGKTEIPFTNADLQNVLENLTNESFAQHFFSSFIYDSNLPDFEKLLSTVGLALRKKHPGKAWLGEVSLTFDDDKCVIEKPTLQGSPLYEAGLDRGDTILRIDDTRIEEKADYEDALQALRPGMAAVLEIVQHGAAKTVTVQVEENPTLEVVTYEKMGKELDQLAIKFRADWLGAKATHDEPPLEKHCPTCNRAHPFEFDFCPYDGAKLGITRG